MLQYNPTVSGSLSVTGTITATQGITGSFSGSVAGFPTDVSAFSASLSTRITATESTSSAYVAVSNSYATTGSNQFNGNQFVTGSLTATGTIVAQTLVVQTITSSVEYVSGSNRFGSTTGNTHEFTGSVLVSGSGYISGNVGIGTTSTSTPLDVYTATSGTTANILRLKNGYNDTSTGLRIKWDFASLDGAYLDVTTNSGGSKTMTVYLSSANATPVEVFSLAGSNKAATFAGSVGIGTSNPQGILHLAGPTGAGSSTQLIFDRLGGYGSYYVNYAYESTYYANGSTLEFKAGNSLTQLRLASNNAYSAGNIQLLGGNVGIGLKNPAKKLDVYDSNGNATAQIKLRNSGTTAAAYLGAFSGHTYLSAGGTYDSGWTTDGSNGIANIVMETTNGGSAIAFGTANSNNPPTERMRIMAGGNVGIGTTNPYSTARLQIRTATNINVAFQTGTLDSSGIKLNSFNDAGDTNVPMELNGSILYLKTGETQRMRLRADGLLDFYGAATTTNAQFVLENTNTNIALYSSNSSSVSKSMSFWTTGAERMRIMSGGAIGTGQSANSTPLRATLVKQGTTSVAFTLSLNTVGAWRPGHATIRVSAAQNGLQEYYAAWYFIRLIGYEGSGVSAEILDSGGGTSYISYSSSSNTGSPQSLTITLTDGGNTTDTMIADIDIVYNQGIISLT